MRRRWGRMEMMHGHLHRHFASKWNNTSDHLIENHAKRVEISSRIYLSPYYLLRRHIIGRSHWHARARKRSLTALLIGNDLDQTKICQNQTFLRCKQDIGRFDITVNNS